MTSNRSPRSAVADGGEKVRLSADEIVDAMKSRAGNRFAQCHNVVRKIAVTRGI